MARRLLVQEYVDDAIQSFEAGMRELRACKSEIEDLVDELVTARSTMQDLEERIANLEADERDDY